MTGTEQGPTSGPDGRGVGKLSPKARRQTIADRVLADGSVAIDDLVRDLGVSHMTIHRDLDLLEREGWLRKIRGGATAAPSALFESNARWRRTATLAEKNAICRLALDEAEPGQAIVVDDSSTVLPFATGLVERGAFTVITNSLQVVNELAEESDIQVISLGGVYHRKYNAFVGMFTADTARTLRADVAYISVSSVEGGLCYHQSQEEVIVKRALLAAARRRVLLVDHTKFGRQALYQLCPLTDFDLVVSDTGLPQEAREELRALGVPLRIADGDEETTD